MRMSQLFTKTSKTAPAFIDMHALYNRITSTRNSDTVLGNTT